MAGPQEATVRDSGGFVAEQQKAGSVQLKAGRHIWFRCISILLEQRRRAITLYLYKVSCCSECLSSRVLREEETIIFN